MADIDDMLSNFDALLAKYQGSAGPTELLQQPDTIPPEPREPPPPSTQPQRKASTSKWSVASSDAQYDEDFDEDFEEDFEEDVAEEEEAPAKPATPEPLKPAARAGRRAGAPATASAAADPLADLGSGGRKLFEPVGNGRDERAGLHEHEQLKQERLVSQAKAEAERLERLEAQRREEEEERRREDEEVERRMAEAKRRKEEAAQRQREADEERQATAGGSFLTALQLPDQSAPKALTQPLAREPQRRTKAPSGGGTRKPPPRKPPTPQAASDNNLTDVLLSGKEKMAALARENAELDAELTKVRKDLERVRKETQVLQSKAGPPRSAGVMRPPSKQSARVRKPPSTADAEREMRLAHNARKQLDYYAKEHEQLRRQVAKLASAEGDIDALSAIVSARSEALAAAVKKGKELARAQKEVQKALGAPPKEDHGRALVLLREEVRVLRERHSKMKGKAESHERDIDNHQARMAEVQSEVDEYTRKMKEMQEQLRVNHEAAAKEAAAADGEAGSKLRQLEQQIEEEEEAVARDKAEQRAKINELVAQIKRERGKVEVATRLSRAGEDELRELELRRKQRERAKREARAASRLAAEKTEAEAIAAVDAHAAAILRGKAPPSRPRNSKAKTGDAMKHNGTRSQKEGGATPNPHEAVDAAPFFDMDLSEKNGLSSAGAGENQAATSVDRGGGSAGASSENGLDLPELVDDVQPLGKARGKAIMDPSSPGGISYTSALDEFDDDDEAEDLEEDIL